MTVKQIAGPLSGSRWQAASEGRPSGIVARVYANLAKIMGGKAAAGLISLAYMVIAVRALGARDYGILILVHGYTVTVGGIIEFPAWQAVVRYGAQAVAGDESHRMVRLLRLSSVVELSCGLLAVAVAALFAPIIGAKLGWSAVAIAFATPYSFAVLATIRSAPAGLLQLHGRFDLLGYHNLVSPCIRLIGASLAWFLGAGLIGFLVTWLIAALAEWASMWLMGWIVAKRTLPDVPLLGSARGALSENPGIVRFMLAANADVTFSELSQRLAPLVVGWIMGPVAAALYAVGQRGSVIIAQPSGNLGQAAYSELARLLAAGGRGREVLHAAVRTAGIAIAVALPIVMIIAVFGTRIALLIGGKAFTEAGTIMFWLVSARAVLLVAPVASAALIAMGRPGLSMKANMGCSLLLLPLLPLLMDRFGLAGAGLHALLTSVAIASLLSLFAFEQSRAMDRAACDERLSSPTEAVIGGPRGED